MTGIGKKFLEQTRPEQNPESPQSRGEVQPPLELAVPEGARLISLPEHPLSRQGTHAIFFDTT